VGLSNPWLLPGFAVLVEAIFLIALVMSFMGDDKTLLNVMCTAAITQAGIVANFLFGSSQGSVRKDEAAAADSAKKTQALAGSAPAVPVAVTAAIDPGQTVTATTTATGEVKP
jgi:hypothetical protein